MGTIRTPHMCLFVTSTVYHRLYVDVSIKMSLIGVTFVHNETVNTSALLSETVIVGDIPQYYGNGNISAAIK